MIAYQNLDNYDEKIDIIKFSDLDLKNLNESEKSYNMIFIFFIIFCFGIILIFNFFIIKYILKNKKKKNNENNKYK